MTDVDKNRVRLVVDTLGGHDADPIKVGKALRERFRQEPEKLDEAVREAYAYQTGNDAETV